MRRCIVNDLELELGCASARNITTACRNDQSGCRPHFFYFVQSIVDNPEYLIVEKKTRKIIKKQHPFREAITAQRTCFHISISCIVTLITRVWINRVRLPFLLVVN